MPAGVPIGDEDEAIARWVADLRERDRAGLAATLSGVLLVKDVGLGGRRAGDDIGFLEAVRARGSAES